MQHIQSSVSLWRKSMCRLWSCFVPLLLSAVKLSRCWDLMILSADAAHLNQKRCPIEPPYALEVDGAEGVNNYENVNLLLGDSRVLAARKQQSADMRASSHLSAVRWMRFIKPRNPEQKPKLSQWHLACCSSCLNVVTSSPFSPDRQTHSQSKSECFSITEMSSIHCDWLKLWLRDW